MCIKVKEEEVSKWEDYNCRDDKESLGKIRIYYILITSLLITSLSLHTGVVRIWNINKGQCVYSIKVFICVIYPIYYLMIWVCLIADQYVWAWLSY